MQFTYYINQILAKHIPGIHSLYAFADDIAFLWTANTLHQLEKQTQTALNIILQRIEDLDCTISIPKTRLLTFNCKISHLHYKQERIHHVKEHKILGVLIDKTLTQAFHTLD
jgi:hypothetical protein